MTYVEAGWTIRFEKGVAFALVGALCKGILVHEIIIAADVKQDMRINLRSKIAKLILTVDLFLKKINIEGHGSHFAEYDFCLYIKLIETCPKEL